MKRLLPLLVVQLLLSLCLLAAAASADALSLPQTSSAPLVAVDDEEEADWDEEAEDDSDLEDAEEEADDEFCELDEEELCEEDAEPRGKGRAKGNSDAAPGHGKAAKHRKAHHKQGPRRGHRGHGSTSASHAAASRR